MANPEDIVEKLDPFDLMDPVDILPQLPNKFYELVEEKKWQLRKEALDALLPLTQTPRIVNGDFQDLTRVLKKFIGKDTNVMLVALAAQCLAGLARGLRSQFKNHANQCLPVVLEKFKEKKVNVVNALVEAIDALYMCLSIEAVQEDCLASLKHKTPSVNAETAKFLARAFSKCPRQLVENKKMLKGYVLALVDKLTHSDVTVRDAASEALGVLMKFLGEPILMKLMPDVDNIKLNKIKEFQEKAQLIRLRSDVTGGGTSDGAGQTGETEEAADVEELDPYDLMDPVDILPKLPKNFYELVEEKKWQLRKEALDALLPLAQTPKIVNGDFQDLTRVLKKFIGKDTNVMLVALAAQCLAGLAKGLRSQFKNHANQCLPVVLEKFKEKKVNVVNALVETVDALYLCLNIEAVQEDCLASLKHKTPSVNAETAKFLARAFSKCPRQLVENKKMLKGYVLALVDKLTHSDVTVRDAASEALGVLMKFLGEPILMMLMPDVDNIKLNKIKEFQEKAQLSGKPASAIKAAPSNQGAKVVKPSAGPKVVKPKPKPSNDDGVLDDPEAAPKPRPVKSAPASKSGTSKPDEKKRLNLVSRGGKSATAGSTRKKGEEVDLSPPYIASNLKNIRFKEESKLKILKWNFTTPRAEFVDQLKEQMTLANFNNTLLTQMFHSDFKQHIKAIESLHKHIIQDIPGLISNLDLILKWITLRFFETNPSVLLKCLDYLTEAFTALAEDSYRLHDIEAKSFIPYLINKSGDPKDAVRNNIKRIIKTLCKVYPASKMSGYLMAGLEAKNAKQRTECLDELGHLIASHGSSVLQPSVGSCLKEIAKHISDRDNIVRNAALNCIAETYFQDGDKLYKVIGNLPEKDMAMLEERIKRQSKTRAFPNSQNSETTKPQHTSAPTSNLSRPQTGSRLQRPVRPNTAPQRQQVAQDSDVGMNNVNQNNNRSPPNRSNKSRPISGAFTLDLDKIESSVGHSSSGDDIGLKLINHNLDDIFNDSPVRLPPTLSTRRQQRFSPPGAKIGSPVAANTKVSNDLVDVPEAYEALDLVLFQIFNQDSSICINAVVQLDELIKDEEKVLLLGKRMDQLLVACCMQYRYVLNTKLRTDNCDQNEVMKLFQFLTMVLMSMYHHQNLTRNASMSSLHDLIHIVVSILLDKGVEQLPESKKLIRALNVLTVKIMERSDLTNVTSALLKLFKESIGNPNLSTKYTELITKCLWKISRSFPEWIDDRFCLATVFIDLHDFMKSFPSSYWKKQESDIPMRTVKTILHTLVKIKGDEVLNHLHKIPDPDNSELVPYLKKLLKNGIGKENNGNQIPDDQQKPKQVPPFSKSDHATLAEIFKKIGQKDNTKLGLQELYNFKQQNPEANLEPFLAKSSQYFREYIERGLKSIEDEVKRGHVGTSVLNKRVFSDTKSNIDPQSSEGGNPSASHYLKKLQQLRQRAGLDSES